MIAKKILQLIIIQTLLVCCVKDQFFKYNYDSNHRADTETIPIYNVFGSWVVLEYEDLENGSVITKTNAETFGGMDVEIKFLNDSTFCGFNTTNEIAGHYTMKDKSVRIDVYGGTKVGQPEWGNMFSDNVYTIDSFERSSSQLRLFYNNHKNCITLYPKRREIICNWTYSKY